MCTKQHQWHATIFTENKPSRSCMHASRLKSRKNNNVTQNKSFKSCFLPTIRNRFAQKQQLNPTFSTRNIEDRSWMHACTHQGLGKQTKMFNEHLVCSSTLFVWILGTDIKEGTSTPPFFFFHLLYTSCLFHSRVGYRTCHLGTAFNNSK